MKKLLPHYIQPLAILTFCLMLFCQNHAMAQVQNFDDRKGVLPNQMIDTRSISMAGSTIADVLGSPSIGVNAALSALSNKPSFIQYNSNFSWNTKLMQHHLTLPTFSINHHHLTARIGFIHQGPASSSTSLTEPDITMYRAEFAYAIALSNYIAIGTLQSISYTNSSGNEDAQYVNYFADVGLVYAPDGPVTYGLVFRGIGHETSYEIIEAGQTTLGSQLATQILEIGVTFRYPLEDRTYLSISFANEKRFGEDGLWYKAGIDLIPYSFISLRGGAIINFGQSLLIPRMGLGIDVNVIRFDYMIAPYYVSGEQFHQIGLTIQF